MAKKRKKKNKIKISFTTLIILLLIVGISFGAYYVYTNYIVKDSSTSEIDLPTLPDDYNEPLVSEYVTYNKQFNIQKDSPFYQSDKDDILNYYLTGNIDFSKQKDELKSSLFELLKKDQIKVNYDGSNSRFGMSKTWANYCLVDRNLKTSPLTKQEVDSNKWNMYVNLDILYQSDDLLFYDKVGSDSKLDREHIWAKSYGFNGADDKYKKLFAGTDLHNLRGADSAGNQTGHNNRLFNDLNHDLPTTSVCIGRDGKSKTYYNDTYFEPLDEDKGDIARSCFYMAVRYSQYYEDSPALVLNDTAIRIPGTLETIDTKDKPAEYGVLSTLLKWNKLDPVDEFEKSRNNFVYNLQNNRNPFIDFPQLAEKLFA